MTVRFHRQGSLLEAMVAVRFLPEKRRVYRMIPSVEGSMILLAGLRWSLSRVGVVPSWFGVVPIAACLIGAMVSVGAVPWLGLSSRELAAEDRISLRRRAPQMLESFAFAVYPERVPDSGPG
jgi:hypothetical protein